MTVTDDDDDDDDDDKSSHPCFQFLKASLDLVDQIVPTRPNCLTLATNSVKYLMPVDAEQIPAVELSVQ